MSPSQVFPLRPFPRRLMRSLITFAAAGTLMAFVVWSDGMGGWWLPLLILLTCWLVPGLFAYQIRRNGFDPLQRFVVTDAGLEAHYRDAPSLFLPWDAITRLVEVEAFRNRTWAIISRQGAIRWFGELEQPEAFAQLVAEKSGLSWEQRSSLPEETS